MLKKMGIGFVGIVSIGLLSTSVMATEFMDATWAKQACVAWNKESILTDQLKQMPSDMFGDGYQWIKNDAGRGYKLIQIYRDDCGESSKIQLNISVKDGKAMCVYGGKPDGKKMNLNVDYVMHATDKDWGCMGTGSCGVMGSMMTGKLKFKGPKFEAMKVMPPFGKFLTLTGKIPGNKGVCKSAPSKSAPSKGAPKKQ